MMSSCLGGLYLQESFVVWFGSVTLQARLVFVSTRGITGWRPLFIFISWVKVYCTRKGVYNWTRNSTVSKTKVPTFQGPGEKSSCLAGSG